MSDNNVELSGCPVSAIGNERASHHCGPEFDPRLGLYVSWYGGRQTGQVGFLRVLRFPPTLRTTRTPPSVPTKALI
ncbi:MAG: hypothetical protein ABW185_14770 [Sedimenticola sp.]